MPTIGGIALSNGRRVPTRDAVLDGCRHWSWAELDHAIAVAAGSMSRYGLRKGDRLAVLCSNSAEYIITCHAGSRLGLIVVPVNTRLAPPEIRFILENSGAAVLAHDAAHADLARTACSTIESARPRAVGWDDGTGDLLDDGSGETLTVDLADEVDDAFILYTSGTTGRPKGVLLDHHRAVWAAMAQIVSLGLRDGDRYLHLTPMYHSGGTTFLNATTLLGGTHVIAGRFDPTTTLDLVEANGVTWLFGVPTMYQQLLRHRSNRQRNLSSWRVGVFGAAAMPSAAAEELLAAFPAVQMFQQCGQTEAGPTGVYSTMAQILARPDSSGHTAQPFMEARVIDAAGTDTEPGGVGELVFRGEAVMKGYWGQPSATAETVRDGWLHTGDLMEVGDDGSLRLVDRLKDVIITGGRNVYSAEVEQAIASHPDVTDVAVIGRPHPEWGATVVAVVTTVPDSDVDAERLREHCRQRIADYKVPRTVIFGDVPRNSTGKVQKDLLRAAMSSFSHAEEETAAPC